jgi:hypothetical protein
VRWISAGDLQPAPAREESTGEKERNERAASATLILTPHRNVWRLAHAERAPVLIDAGRYFGALRQALITAQSSVFFIGWDLDSRTRLVGEIDTECDLAIEGSAQGERRAIERLRNRLQAWMRKNRQPGKDGAEFEEGVAASQRTFDDAQHATLLARDEDAVRIGRVVAEGRACSVDAPYPI